MWKNKGWKGTTLPKEILIGARERRASSPCLFFFFFLAKQFFTEAMRGGQMADGENGSGYAEGSSKTLNSFLWRNESPVSQWCITYPRGLGEDLLRGIAPRQVWINCGHKDDFSPTEVIFFSPLCVTSKSVVLFSCPPTDPFTPSSASLVPSVFKFIHANTGPLLSSCPAELTNASGGRSQR